MPWYDYKCIACGKVFEVVQTYSEHDNDVDHERERPLRCPGCNSKKLEHCVAASVNVITSKKS
jgi:putative FmdB family regulatory protein